LRGHPYSGFFIDIGVPKGLAAAAELVPKQRRRPAVFLDRDGVLNIDRGYDLAPEQLEWVRGAKQAVKLLNDAGYYLFVVTNQAGVARGHYNEAAVGALHGWMAKELSVAGASIDDWRCCPFHPEGSVAAFRAQHDWRKPKPGMLLDLFEHWPVEREGAFSSGTRAATLRLLKRRASQAICLKAAMSWSSRAAKVFCPGLGRRNRTKERKTDFDELFKRTPRSAQRIDRRHRRTCANLAV
jgi:D,D-heptose 1,7-bisphosphate phosphatase